MGKIKKIKRAGWDEVAWDWYKNPDSEIPRDVKKNEPDFYAKSGRFGRNKFYVEIMGTDPEKLKKFKKIFNQQLLKKTDKVSWAKYFNLVLDKFENKPEGKE